MYRKKDRHTGELFQDIFPFGGGLDPDNRWMKMSGMVPWEELEREYASKLSRLGRPALDARLVLGLLILKHVTNFSDEELSRHFSENIYMQAFCGFDNFASHKAIDSSTLSVVRRRLGPDFFRHMESLTYKVLLERGIIKGKGVLCDATVIPEKISYPNDVGLLEKCRRKTVAFIKSAQSLVGMKYRTYCRTARNLALSFQKRKKKTKKMVELAKKKALNFLSRNIKQAREIIQKGIGDGVEIVFKELSTIEKIFLQQKEMYRNKCHRIVDRIVSISKPYVRPIKRGKTGKEVEFGPKGAFSYVGGFLFLDHLSHDNFSEAGNNIVRRQLENFEAMFGRKPDSFTGDNLYGTRENRKFMDENNVRAAFKPLGRHGPARSPSEKRWQKKKHRERNRVEGAFGHAKEHLGLKPIRYKTKERSEIWIRLGLLGMNLKTAVSRA